MEFQARSRSHEPGTRCDFSFLERNKNFDIPSKDMPVFIT